MLCVCVRIDHGCSYSFIITSSSAIEGITFSPWWMRHLMSMDQRPLMGTFSEQPKCPKIEFIKKKRLCIWQKTRNKSFKSQIVFPLNTHSQCFKASLFMSWVIYLVITFDSVILQEDLVNIIVMFSVLSCLRQQCWYPFLTDQTLCQHASIR